MNQKDLNIIQFTGKKKQAGLQQNVRAIQPRPLSKKGTKLYLFFSLGRFPQGNTSCTFNMQLSLRMQCECSSPLKVTSGT